eukprot:EG_transcript_34097
MAWKVWGPFLVVWLVAVDALPTKDAVAQLANESRRLFPEQHCRCLQSHHPQTKYDIFWHMTVVKKYYKAACKVLESQWRKMLRAGLISVSTLHIGLIGESTLRAPAILRLILRAKHVRLAAFAPPPPSPHPPLYECVTSNPMLQYAREYVQCRTALSCTGGAVGAVLYLHSKGITHGARP